MPELPEVETIVRGLRSRILQKDIYDIQVFLPKIIRTAGRSPTDLIDKTLLSVSRLGKNIILELSQGWHIRVHLKMTGQLLVNLPGEPLKKHTHAVFYLEAGKGTGVDTQKLELRYRDIRQFGYIQILTAAEWPEWCDSAGLGPDALEISWPSFWARLQAKKGKIKTVLLDQSFLAGLGNIYVDEILHRAKIHPESSPPHLSSEEIHSLYQNMQSVLKKAIQYKGSSVRDYIEASGQQGQYQTQHQVYGRAGLACPQCGTEIEKIRVAGRGTCFCPQCQRIKK